MTVLRKGVFHLAGSPSKADFGALAAKARFVRIVLKKSVDWLARR